ncbi:Fibroblast growth factor receptor 3, partial [Aphelenchoides avenae]
ASYCTTAPKDPRTKRQARNKHAQIYELRKEEPDSDYETISLGSQASWLYGPHRCSLRSTVSVVNNAKSDAISRSSSQISVNDDQGKQETMRVVSEEDPRTLKADVSGVPDGQLHRFREPAFILFLYATVFSDSLEVRNKFYIDHDLIRISRNAIGFGAFTTVYKGTLLSQKLNSSPHAMSDQLALDVAVRTRSRRYSTNKSRFVYDALREMRVLHEVGPNENLVKPVGYSYMDDEPILVLEYCERGNVLTYLRTHLRDYKTAVEH